MEIPQRFTGAASGIEYTRAGSQVERIDCTRELRFCKRVEAPKFGGIVALGGIAEKALLFWQVRHMHYLSERCHAIRAAASAGSSACTDSIPGPMITVSSGPTSILPGTDALPPMDSASSTPKDSENTCTWPSITVTSTV